MSATLQNTSLANERSSAQQQTHFQPQQSTFEFGPWLITAKKSHILQSKCEKSLTCETDSGCNICSFCRYEKDLDLPKIPDMVFADNVLRIEHKQYKCGIEFNALDALKMVDNNQDCLKVAVADAWREARADSEHMKDVIKPYDWTFTTKYKGSFFGVDRNFKVTPTTERIDVEKLKRKEKILFYEDVHLFEDELADNGCAFLSVKIRAMPSCIFLLQRFYLRVDNVLVRIHDTRLYCEAETNLWLREFSVRESKSCDLDKLPFSTITDPNEVCNFLKLNEEEVEKLEIQN